MNTERVGARRRAVGRWLAAGCALAVAMVSLVATSTTGRAQAAVPDRFGYVLWNGGAVIGSGTTPAATTVTTIGVGRYLVVFPGQAAAGGVAHVTAIADVAHWCQLNSFGPSGADEQVFISCYKAGGGPDVAGFSAIFSSSSGPASALGRYGYVYSQPGGAIISQYNSAALPNTVTHSGTGVWKVNFAGLATPGPVDGSLQATAVNPQIPARCKVANWSSGGSQTAMVLCFNAGGGVLDTQFTLSYQYQRSLYGAVAPPKYFGYLWNTPPVGPPSTNFNFATGGMNTIGAAGLGLSIVQFQSLARLPDNIDVTAFGSGSEFCGLNTPWTHTATDTIVRDVNCFDTTGAAINTGFLISDNTIF